MKILLSETHSGYTSNLLQGGHDYTVMMRWPSPRIVRSVARRQAEIHLGGSDIHGFDIVVLQTRKELREWARHNRFHGFNPGEAGAVYLEHDPPPLDSMTRHDADFVEESVELLVNVTEFNNALWTCDKLRSIVIEHGVARPEHSYGGEMRSAAVVINEPVRRGKAVGWDLVEGLRSQGLAVALFGGGTERIGGSGFLPPAELHQRMALCAVYLHPFRRTSLGLTLLEAMHMGMPIVAYDAPSTRDAVPGDAMLARTASVLKARCGQLLVDRALAVEVGRHCQERARARFGLDRFLTHWNQAFESIR